MNFTRWSYLPSGLLASQAPRDVLELFGQNCLHTLEIWTSSVRSMVQWRRWPRSRTRVHTSSARGHVSEASIFHLKMTTSELKPSRTCRIGNPVLCAPRTSSHPRRGILTSLTRSQSKFQLCPSTSGATRASISLTVNWQWQQHEGYEALMWEGVFCKQWRPAQMKYDYYNYHGSLSVRAKPASPDLSLHVLL